MTNGSRVTVNVWVTVLLYQPFLKDDLFIIDQHASDEKCNYEKFMTQDSKINIQSHSNSNKSKSFKPVTVQIDLYRSQLQYDPIITVRSRLQYNN